MNSGHLFLKSRISAGSGMLWIMQQIQFLLTSLAGAKMRFSRNLKLSWPLLILRNFTRITGEPTSATLMITSMRLARKIRRKSGSPEVITQDQWPVFGNFNDKSDDESSLSEASDTDTDDLDLSLKNLQISSPFHKRKEDDDDPPPPSIQRVDQLLLIELNDSVDMYGSRDYFEGRYSLYTGIPSVMIFLKLKSLLKYF